ncbi:hypothetical protein CLIB1423_02S06348 [[Candida] railenensis]|uniref:MARVEL domain-containing protein n=1 Tax=[Candida] railenensis TaxID=45579 RepID=A0A9P0QLY9_9ASCO|nr:hypothetical protein CLIB1423_02S06348 [[Candida] railenensis]
MPAPFTFRVFNRSGDFVVSLALRGVQILFTIIVLGTSAGAVSSPWGSGYFEGPACGLAVSIIDLIWLVVTLFLSKYLLSLLVTVAESIITILWIVAFGLLASNFAGVNCDYFDDDIFFYGGGRHSWKGCSAGKAAAAFAFLLFVLHIATLTLHVLYGLVPLNKVDNVLLKKLGTLSIGAIFPLESQAAVGHQETVVGDLEAGQSSIEKDQSVTDEPVPATNVESVDEPVVAKDEVPKSEELPNPETRD